MGGSTFTCPICLMTYRVNWTYMDKRDFEDTPFYMENDRIYCRKCKLPIMHIINISEYAKNLYKDIIRYDEKRLNECIYKGYFSEAVLMLHIQITEQLRYLLQVQIEKMDNFPIDKLQKQEKIEDFLKNMKSYSIISLATIYGRINDEESKILFELNSMRNKFAHTFEERKKYDFDQMKNIIDKSKNIEIRLRKLVEKYKPTKKS